MIRQGVVHVGDGNIQDVWSIEITDGVITYAGPRANYAEPPGAQIIEALGKTIMPGVINAHVRGTDYADPNFMGQSIRRQFLLDGVTSTCNTGHSLESLPSFEEGPIVNGAPIGRAFNSGPQFATGIPLNAQPQVAAQLQVVETDDEIAITTAQVAIGGAEYVQLSVGEVLHANQPSVKSTPYTPVQLDKIIGTAHGNGLLVRASVIEETWATRAATRPVQVIDFTPRFNSVDSVLSSQNSDPNLFVFVYENQSINNVIEGPRTVLIEMAARQMIMVPMITVMDARFPWQRSETQSRSDAPRSMYEEVVQFFHTISGRVALGSGFQPDGALPGMPMNEIAALQRAGLSNEQIVVAATMNSALACGVSDQIGTIEVGKKADLLILDGDIRFDISVLENPRYVILDGKIVVGK